MTNKEEFLQQHPEVHFLAADDLAGLAVYLRERNLIDADEPLLRAERAGEGNMNCTVRAVTSSRAFILKQARPWVEKYPQIAAPWDRALVEGAFYAKIATQPIIAGMMPRLLGFDAASRIIALEDLGQAGDFTPLYRGEVLPEAAIDELARYLTHLHRAFIAADFKADFANRAMRELNHHHVFCFPLLPLPDDNSFDLDAITPGLGEAGRALKQDRQYVAAVTNLGKLYLAGGDALLHGDYFPGSWLKTAAGVRVIDPEFCFFGPVEFDLGVMIAHLRLSNQKDSLTERLLEKYQPHAALDRNLIWRFAGVEIMRRLIGVAQLPFKYDLKAKVELLDLSREWMLNQQPADHEV